MRVLKRITALMLSLIMIFGLLPAAQAVDPEEPAQEEDHAVLTSIGHEKANEIFMFTDEEDREALLTVPFLYAEAHTELDLFNGLVIDYDVTKYKNVVATPLEKAPIPRTEEEEADSVTVIVSYNLIDDANSAPTRETEYTVRVFRAAQIPAKFIGSISKNVCLSNQPEYVIPAEDIIGMYAQNEGRELGAISITGSNLVAGELKHGGTIYDFDTKVVADAIEDVTFCAKEIGRVSYNINAFDTSYTVNEQEAYIGTAVVTFFVYKLPEITEEINFIGYIGSSVNFTSADFVDRCKRYGMPIEGIEITPEATEAGTWYFGTTELTPDASAEIPIASVCDLRFVCDSAGEAPFTWSAKNEGGYSEEAGAGYLKVEMPTIVLSSYSSSTTVSKGNTWTITPDNFVYSPATAKLTYIKITAVPAAADGTLSLSKALVKNDLLGYPAIAANASLKAGSIIPYDFLKYLKLATKATSSNNYISFSWTATADSVLTSAEWAEDANYTVRYLAGGNVSYSTYANVPVSLSASDFSSQFSSASGYTLAYITVASPSKTCGTFMLDYDPITKKGKTVSASTKYFTGATPNISSITFVPAQDYAGTVNLDYKAYKSDGTFLSGKLNIYVSSSSGGSVSYTTDKNAAVRFEANDFKKAFTKSTGRELSYVKFTLPVATKGKLYYDYVTDTNYESVVSSSTKYHVYSSQYLSYVSFMPYKNFTGIMAISYTAYDKSGNSYDGRINITVIDSPAGIVQYKSKINAITKFVAGDFSNEFITVTGSVLHYIQFTPPAKTEGTLYYKYSPDTQKGTKVTASTKFYDGANPDVSELCFIPVKDYAGEVVMKYTVFTMSGVSYVGKLKIRVGDGNPNAISYVTDSDSPVRLIASDFVSKYNSDTGGTLASVTIDPPSSSCGKLYYNYVNYYTYDSEVTSSTRYNVSSNPFLSSISFVPRSGYSGTFSTSYTAYSADGNSSVGKISITVKGGDGTIEYSTKSGKHVTFSTSDFRLAFEEMTGGKTLSYVKFTPPSSSYGTLYYRYDSSSSSNSQISSSTKYYASTYPYISSVSFLPKSTFSGATTIRYTAFTDNGDDYYGTISVTVTGSSGGTVKMKTAMNTPVSLDGELFADAYGEGTNATLRGVKFTLPSANTGTLYYNYASESDYGSKISAGTRYYVTTSPLLSNITFVPHDGFFGTATIEYATYDSTGETYTGELIIEIVQPFDDVGADYAWATPAISNLFNRGVVQGSGDGKFNPGQNMSRGDFMLMVYRAFDIAIASKGNFDDVLEGSYYYEAIAAAKSLGIAKGDNGKFAPDDGISRQDAMVIIMRTLEFLGEDPELGSEDDLTSFYDATVVSDYAVEAVSTLVKAGIIKGSSGYITPLDMISRAEMAVLLHRVLTK